MLASTCTRISSISPNALTLYHGHGKHFPWRRMPCLWYPSEQRTLFSLRV
jgi:hypothetical protein